MQQRALPLATIHAPANGASLAGATHTTASDWPNKVYGFKPLEAAVLAFVAGLGYPGDASPQRELQKLERRAKDMGFKLYVLDTPRKRAIILVSDAKIYVSFEGSRSAKLSDWMNNAYHRRVPHPLGGTVHAGIWGRMNQLVTAYHPPDTEGSPSPVASCLGKPFVEPSRIRWHR